MSRRWLLSLLCLSVFFLSLVQLTGARGEFKVNESTTRILLDKKPAKVLLAVENSTGETLNTTVDIQLLDPRNNTRASLSQLQSIGPGSQKLSFVLPFSFSNLNEIEGSELLWYRLRYRVTDNNSNGSPISEGIISLSGITPDLFELRVATSGLAREARRYHTRVRATHPITGQPAGNVRVDGELTLESNNNDIKLRASKTTDSEGYALLDFVIPPRFPHYPHELRPAGGQMALVGRKGGVVATANGEVLVDQFARILLSSDKPLYQPGQTMHLRALTFTPSKRALANQNAFFRITEPNGTVVLETVGQTTRFGVANTDWPIPENTRLGDYRVWAGVEGSEDATQTAIDVRISRYDLPNFTVNVEPDRTYYLSGQNAEVKVRADYLFGKPITRGRVRVVREDQREWNFREQKWEVEEGETHEGETDANGVFTARINLASDHEKVGDNYRNYNDITYAAYFTDPTTNRTEQRRFDLRVTRDAIHVYIIEEEEWVENKRLPLKFYVSTYYADGVPAQCKINVAVKDSDEGGAVASLATLRTNRYGIAKVSGVRFPADIVKDQSEVELLVTAVDSKDLKGSGTDEIRFDPDDRETVRVETDKALYRAGEPFTAFVTSTVPDQTVVIDVVRDSSVIRSQRVKLRDGRGSAVFPYRPDFNDRLTIVAYGDSAYWGHDINSDTILYPRPQELDVKVRPSQTTYQPGEDAQVNLSVRSPEGLFAESALGVVVFDKAVEERFRTAQEFGSSSPGINASLQSFLGLDDQIAGVSLRDLQRLDMSRPISPELELLADVLLTQSGGFYPTFYRGDEYEHEPKDVFGYLVKEQLKPMREALATRYARTLEYPSDEKDLQRLLSESKIEFNSVRDPWGTTYRPAFSFFQGSDDLVLLSAGADKRFDTSDDFVADQLGWPYFRPRGQSIDSAVDKYYNSTGIFIRDLTAFRTALSTDGLNPDEMRDRWGKPYRFEFELNANNYLIKVRSSGPDGKYSTNEYYSPDDFTIWTSAIDYFEKTRAHIDDALKQSKKPFPETEHELRAALQNSRGSLDTLRDPWNQPYYVTFKTETFSMDRLGENRAGSGEAATTRVAFTPVTQTVRLIAVRSIGADHKQETNDDFSVAVLTAVLSEQLRGNGDPKAVNAGFVITGNNGWIHGVVTDSNGAAIPRATVVAKPFTGETFYQTSTGDDGSFLLSLPPGTYTLHFDAPGFMLLVNKEVLVRASYVTELNPSLRPGAAVETVTVTAASEALMTLSASSVRSVPGRNFVAVTKSGPQLSTPRLREYFPETLLWQPSIETDKQGRAKINFKLADNITTWKMVVIGSTEDGQVGIGEKEITAFQPFFVEHDPPRVLTEGDEISLPVTVRNYLGRRQKVDLEIKPENWFSLSGPTRKQISVDAGEATRETFDLRAITSIKDGKQRITAIGSDDSDAIEKPVTVHPDGEERSITDGDVISERSALELDVPQTMIPNSMRAELKIYPNLMAHVLESVEGIMQRPYGCGEQTISSTYPSLLLLRHYKHANENFPLRGRAERYVNEGYSRLLKYRHASGGFTYWGDDEPDLALTAYAVRFLTDASDVISVDKNVISNAREWLVKQQLADGSWGANENDTVYVTRILAQGSSEKSDALKKALAYLGKRAPDSKDPYLLALHTLVAIATGDLPRAKLAIEKVQSLAQSEGPATYWSVEKSTPFHGWGLAGRVETTALVIQAMSKYCGSQTTSCDQKFINRALLYLLREKDRYGVWYSTQATINSLDAILMLFSKQAGVQTLSGETELLINGRVAQTIQIPVAQRLRNPMTIDITQFLNTGNNKIEFRRPGGLPLATVQAVANFYVPWSESTEREEKGLRLQVKFDKTEGSINDEITCSVEAARVDPRGYGMLLAEIGLPPGVEVDRNSLQEAMAKSDGTLNQYDVLPDRVVVYLWPRGGSVKFNFKFRPRLGLNAKTAPSTVYDYYNPESRAVVAPATFRVR